MKTLTTSALCLLLLCGCAEVEREQTPLGVDRPAQGKALVIFYRQRRYIGSLRGIQINDGSKPIGDLGNGTYFVHQADPGTHLFMGNGHDEDAASVTLQPGRSYYYKVSIEPGAWLPHYSVQAEPEEQAHYDMRDLQRVRWTGR